MGEENTKETIYDRVKRDEKYQSLLESVEDEEIRGMIDKTIQAFTKGFDRAYELLEEAAKDPTTRASMRDAFEGKLKPEKKK